MSTDFGGVDWSKSDDEIAKELSESLFMVQMNRRERELLSGKSVAPVAKVGKRRGRVPIFDWSVVDWGMRNVDIAKQIGCGKSTVGHKRVEVTGKLSRPQASEVQKVASLKREERKRQLREVGSRSPSVKRYDYSKVDFSRDSIGEIILKVGCHRDTAEYHKHKWEKAHAVQEPKKEVAVKISSFQPKYDFSDVDWNRRSIDIAKDIGCSPSTVKTHKSRYFHKHILTSGHSLRIDWPHVDWSKKDSVLAKELSCSVGTVYLKRKAFGSNKVNIPEQKSRNVVHTEQRGKTSDIFGEVVDKLVEKIDSDIRAAVKGRFEEYRVTLYRDMPKLAFEILNRVGRYTVIDCIRNSSERVK